ncbi:MAG: type II toxin-antitoxin system VapC family toxin [Pyrinomonadaceae bacterium]
MLLLLDTHIFLWLISDDSRLPDTFRETILQSENTVLLSAASVWEIMIKFNLGKLPLPESPEIYIPRQRDLHMIATLPVTEASLKYLCRLPDLHTDPFDRCLISQALSNGLTLVTVDPSIMRYDVPLLK